jgi:hypothetical protein
MNMKSLLIAAALLLSLPIHAAAAETTAKACEAKAKAWFAGTHGTGTKTFEDGRTSKTSYQARYNAKRKQCLVRLTTDTAAKDPRPAVANVSVRALGDKNAMLASVVHVRGQADLLRGRGQEMPDPAGMGRTDRALDDGVSSASERAMAQSVKRKLEFPVAAACLAAACAGEPDHFPGRGSAGRHELAANFHPVDGRCPGHHARRRVGALHAALRRRPPRT